MGPAEGVLVPDPGDGVRAPGGDVGGDGRGGAGTRATVAVAGTTEADRDEARSDDDGGAALARCHGRWLRRRERIGAELTGVRGRRHPVFRASFRASESIPTSSIARSGKAAFVLRRRR
eukprot:scaffold16890_cov110-Isochrysis_galbana.AAC.10